MSNTAKIELEGKLHELPTMTGTEGEKAIDISTLRNSTGYVTLDEGPAVLTNFVDCDLSKLAIGQKVKVKFQTTEGGPPVPVFSPI